MHELCSQLRGPNAHEVPLRLHPYPNFLLEAAVHNEHRVRLMQKDRILKRLAQQ